jgi:F420-non-reducing hydrogenase iron-sulfur subunit
MENKRFDIRFDKLSEPISSKPDAQAGDMFEPEITAFYCIYCGYMAADTAGSMGVQYPANVKFVRMPCTGKTDIRYILEAFEQGADGVYVVACPIGNCHHVRGNERGRARVERARKILEEIGFDGKRLGMFYMSGSQAQTFAAAAHTMTERVRELGPNPLKNGQGQTALPQTLQPLTDEMDEDLGFRGRKIT